MPPLPRRFRLALTASTSSALGTLLMTAVSLSPKSAQAFPEMVRHGYPNCSACHISPNGGGMLSEYGRGLSKELLSTWGYENSELVGHGLFKPPPEWLHLGGDVRSVQTFENDPIVDQAQFFFMQTDFEAGVTLGKFTFDGTIGIQGGPPETPNVDTLLSRRHYVLYRYNDEITVRGGKFYPQYGINDPDHTLYTRRGLGFDQGNERYNLELAYGGPKFDAFLTAIFGRPDTDNQPDQVAAYPDQHDKGVAASASLWLLEAYKVGVSALTEQGPARSRQMGGLWGILGFGKQVYLETEFDLEWLQPKIDGAPEQHGFTSFARLGYEFYKGLHVYGIEEILYSDFNDITSRTDSYGAGLDLYPMPHFEIQAEYRRERAMNRFPTYYDTGFMMFHYYL